MTAVQKYSLFLIGGLRSTVNY